MRTSRISAIPGPDALSGGQHRLADIWRVLAPLVRRHALKGLLIEASFPDDVPDAQLFGHLTPAWLLRELDALAAATGGTAPLKGLPVLVGHIKPSLVQGRDPRALVKTELEAGNRQGVAFVLPSRGRCCGCLEGTGSGSGQPSDTGASSKSDPSPALPFAARKGGGRSCGVEAEGEGAKNSLPSFPANAGIQGLSLEGREGRPPPLAARATPARRSK